MDLFAYFSIFVGEKPPTREYIDNKHTYIYIGYSPNKQPLINAAPKLVGVEVANLGS